MKLTALNLCLSLILAFTVAACNSSSVEKRDQNGGSGTSGALGTSFKAYKDTHRSSGFQLVAPPSKKPDSSGTAGVNCEGPDAEYNVSLLGYRNPEDPTKSHLINFVPNNFPVGLCNGIEDYPISDFSGRVQATIADLVAQLVISKRPDFDGFMVEFTIEGFSEKFSVTLDRGEG